MTDTITVALLGLGHIGNQFAAGLSSHIAEGASPIKIVAVAEANPDSEAAAKLKQRACGQTIESGLCRPILGGSQRVENARRGRI
jgi:predicted dehydrogenase